MDQFDIVIVGGGPAGLSAAHAASTAGAKTIVLERKREIGRPVHTSGGTYVQFLRELKVPEDLYHVVSTIRISAPLEEAVFVLKEPTVCVLDVTGTYKYLALRAEQAGALIKTGATVLEPHVNDPYIAGCTYKTADGQVCQVKAKITIDASGYNAIIAKAIGLNPGFRRFGVGAEIEYIAPYCRQDEAIIIVGSRYAPAGYGWVFPWGKNRVRIGVGILNTDSNANPRACLDVVASEAHQFGVDLTDATVVERHFGLVPAEGLLPSFVGDGLMVVGDAAGQASMIAGEGIRLAIMAGKLAGDIGALAIRKGIWNKENLQHYDKLFRRRNHNKQLGLGYLINKRMARWNDAVWNKRVRQINRMKPEFLASLLQSQFSPIKILWFAATNPALWPGAFRRILQYMLKGITRCFKAWARKS